MRGGLSIKEIINFWRDGGRTFFISFCRKTGKMWRRKMLQRPDGTGGLFISCPNIMDCNNIAEHLS